MNTQKRSLVLIDDDAAELFAWSMVLSRLQYSIHSTGNAHEAFSLMKSLIPSAVIMETDFDGMTSFDLVKRMREDQSLKSVPVIIHTASSAPDLEARCRSAGCDAFFKKPADIDSLFKSIQEATEESPRKSIRIEIFLKVWIGHESDPENTGRAEFATVLSDYGLFVISERPYPVGAVLTLTLQIMKRNLRVTGVVQYSTRTKGHYGEPGMGIQFKDMNPDDRKFLSSYIKDLIENKHMI